MRQDCGRWSLGRKRTAQEGLGTNRPWQRKSRASVVQLCCRGTSARHAVAPSIFICDKEVGGWGSLENSGKRSKSKGLTDSLLTKAIMGMCMCPRARATVTSQGLFQSLVKGRSCQILSSLHENLALPVSHCPFSSPQPHCDHLHASGTTAPWKEKKVGISPSSRGFLQSPLERSCLVCAREEVHDFSAEGCRVWA